MRVTWSRAAVAAGMIGSVGCEVREVRRPPPPPPPPERVVYVEPAAPPPPVEVIPVSPGPEYVYVRGGYYRDHDRWVVPPRRVPAPLLTRHRSPATCGASNLRQNAWPAGEPSSASRYSSRASGATSISLSDGAAFHAA